MGLLYYIIKPFVSGLLPVYYKKITIDNRTIVPKKGPVLIASNHPNSFMDALIMGSYMKRTANFLVRGDVFKNPVVRFILEQTNQIPIYRKRDGYSNVKQNDKTFEICYNKFENNELITIYSEGLCITEKRLRPIQKGTARMAFGLYDERGIDNLVIIPHGINYFEGTKARTTVMTSYGNPIYVKDYISLYKEDPAKAVRKLTEDIADQLKGLVIHNNDPRYDETVDRLLVILQNTYPDNILPVEFNDYRLERERHFVNIFNDKQDSEKAGIKRKTDEYFNTLLEFGLSDKVVSDKTRGNFFLQLFGVIILFVPFLLVCITHGWMYYIANKVVNDKVKQNEFKTSVRFAIPMVFEILITFVLVVLLFFDYNFYIKILFFWTVIPALVFNYPLMLKKLKDQFNWIRMNNVQKEKLKSSRQRLMDNFKLGESVVTFQSTDFMY